LIKVLASSEVSRSVVVTVTLAALTLLAADTPFGATAVTGIRVDNPAPQENAQFGFAVTGLDDVNADGTSDFAVGAPGAGRVYVFSGSDRSVLHEIADPDDLTGTQCQPSQAEPSPCNFGYAVVAVGDVNNDGSDDLGVSAPGQFGAVALPCGINDPDEPCPQEGRAFIFSGASGALLVTLTQVSHAALKGIALAPLGLVNGDATPDVALVAAGNAFGAGGLVAAFSGADGSVLWTRPPLPTNVGIPGFVSAPLAAVDDLTADGVTDLVVGADCAEITAVTCAGKAYVLSGSDGTVIRTHDNPTPMASDSFGVGVGAVGDQDADGTEDYAVTEPGGATSTGSVIHLFSGATGAAIGTPIAGAADERNAPGSTHKTMPVASVDDKSGDGAQDFWVGASSTGAAHLLDKQGNVLFEATDPIADTGFGISVAPLGALPGQSGLDAIVGAPFRAVGSVEGAGAVFLLRPQADLQTTKTAMPTTATPGDVVTYTVTVTNDGPFPAASVHVTDEIPAGTTFVTGSLADDPACSFEAVLNRIDCMPGALAVATSFSLDFDVRIADDADIPATVSNTAAASSSTLDPDASNNSATAAASVTCDIVGTDGDDVLAATSAGESICGLGGNDHLIGLGAGDVLVGGPGDDILHGGEGDDVLRGGSGADQLYGQIGADDLSGGDGNDSLFGGPGFDLLDGGSGVDTCKTQGDAGTSSACEAGGS
jgi:uncharacterized repeat protein (TIGR01451 family)